MTLRFYDTASAEVRDFVPLVPGKVSLYYCGATVQGMPHVGHIRSAIAFDQLTRWLQYRGFRVTVVRNVTDIDDKILAKSAASFGPDFEGEPGALSATRNGGRWPTATSRNSSRPTTPWASPGPPTSRAPPATSRRCTP